MRWYALRSKPNKEEALWRELGGDRQVFYPYVRVRPINPRSRRLRAYFPGYLFVRMNHLAAGPAAFSTTPHAQGLICFGGEAADVPDGLVAALQARVNEINEAGGEEHNPRGKPEPRFRCGDKVAIKEGPFAGYQAVFDEHLAGDERVRVLLQLLQSQPMKLDLPAGQVQTTNRR